MKKNKFQIKREATYANLIQAGFEVLCEKGYSGATVDDVVKHAGYTKGAFYVHFESKEQFFLHLIDYQKQIRTDELYTYDANSADDLTLEAAVGSLVKRLIQYLKKSPEWLLVYVDFFIQSKQSPETAEKYKHLYNMGIGETEQFINFLKSKQLVDAELDATYQGKLIFAFLDGAILHYNFYKEVLDEEIVTDVIVRLLSPR